MELLYFAIPIGIAIGAIFVIAFVWAARSGQFDDLEGPAHRAIHPQRPAAPPASVQARGAPAMPRAPTPSEVRTERDPL